MATKTPESKLGEWVHRPITGVDPDLVPFWEGLKTHQFLLCSCKRCGSWWFPYGVCNQHPEILDFEEMHWVPSSGRGTVFAKLVVHQVVDQAFADEVPYALVIVALEEGPHFPTRMVGDPDEISIGSPVEVAYFDSDQSGQTLPLFKLRETA